MMFNDFFNIALVYILIGILTAFATVFIFKKKVLGNFWGALLVALAGALFGALLEILLKDVFVFLANINGKINIFPPLFTAIILLHIFHKISANSKKDD